jgi:hypothetical protein
MLSDVDPKFVEMIKEAFFLGAHGASWLHNHFSQDEYSDEVSEKSHRKLIEELEEFGVQFRKKYRVPRNETIH